MCVCVSRVVTACSLLSCVVAVCALLGATLCCCGLWVASSEMLIPSGPVLSGPAAQSILALPQLAGSLVSLRAGCSGAVCRVWFGVSCL